MHPHKLQRSTESYGLGQSGYTAGRVEGDRSLEQQLEDRNAASPERQEEEDSNLGLDDRFTGRGRRRWVPRGPA